MHIENPLHTDGYMVLFGVENSRCSDSGVSARTLAAGDYARKGTD